MARKRSTTREQPLPPWSGVRLVDGLLLLAFLSLTFLLGVFPLKDTDFWWHLRTGDLIRQTWRIPVTDWYTFGAADHTWIDLHWLFEVALSWGYELGGIAALNLAKCAITTASLLILLTARRRDWPVWVMLLAWLPALFVLSGRMYVRPETVSLLYLSIDLAVLFRLDRWPKLGYIVPLVQVFWVNSQGLFVLGPIVLAFAIIDALLKPGSLSPARRPWWRTVLSVTALTALACLVNPYGLLGAVFPFQLAQTMGNPIFARTIAELMPVSTFIAKIGLGNLPLQIHLLTMVLGALSFLIPLTWRAIVRLQPAAQDAKIPADARKSRKRKKETAKPSKSPPVEIDWHLSPFRLLLFAAFSLLSWKATRNTHQFAAVVGTVTAWNFGEWAAALRRRHTRGDEATSGKGLIARLATLGALVLALLFVGTGTFYAWAGEGRTIGLGEEPLWYPHEAIRFAGGPDMPERFICFHNGHAALYEYAHGPERKVYADARLEVIGPDVYRRYIELETRIRRNEPGWSEELDALGRPGVLVDNVHAEFAGNTAALLGHPLWRCVWFDPIATVFVPESSPASIAPVDFLARHFQPDPATDPKGFAPLKASAKILFSIAAQLYSQGRIDRARPLVLLGVGYARRLRQLQPDLPDGWLLGGVLETMRTPVGSPEKPIPRFRMPFDPIFDLSPARATYTLRQAIERSPDDSMAQIALASSYLSRGMYGAALPLWKRLQTIRPAGKDLTTIAETQEMARVQALRTDTAMGPMPSVAWKNMDELDRATQALLGSGRAEQAAELLEQAYRPETRPWNVTDLLATLYVHLGQPDQARATWQSAVTAVRPALVAARVAMTYLIEDDFEKARQHFREALSHEPGLFEAHYGLAVLERDAGRASAMRAAARRAVATAPSDEARRSAEEILKIAAPEDQMLPARPASESEEEFHPPLPGDGVRRSARATP